MKTDNANICQVSRHSTKNKNDLIKLKKSEWPPSHSSCRGGGQNVRDCHPRFLINLIPSEHISGG